MTGPLCTDTKLKARRHRYSPQLQAVCQMLLDNARAEPWAKPLTQIVAEAEKALTLTLGASP